MIDKDNVLEEVIVTNEKEDEQSVNKYEEMVQEKISESFD